MLLAVAPVIAALAAGAARGEVAPRKGYEEVAAELERVIDHEVEAKALPAFSIALVDGAEIVWARGFGFADPEKKVPATADTVHRVGSVSKLLNAIAVMQLVERGELDLDVPVERYLPELALPSGSGKPVTLRQILSHRSGLVRESPVGHYFDPAEPSLRDTVLSLAVAPPVYEPGARTKYSNAAPALAGYIVERRLGKPFAAAVKETVIAPLGLQRSSFDPEPEIVRDLATAYMWTYDGRVFPAPAFRIGTAPAGNLYASMTDLARLLIAVFRGGEGERGRVLSEESLRAMLALQFPEKPSPEKSAREGFGLGFALSELDGHPRFGHGGMVYGFATEVGGLADVKLGAAAAATMDGANGVVRRIVDHALACLLARRDGKPLPRLELGRPLDPALARRLAGRHEAGDDAVELWEDGGKLRLLRRALLLEVRSLGGRLVADDRLAHGPEIKVEDDGIRIGERLFRRAAAKRPVPPPAGWRGLIGEYGWDHDTLTILEKDGALHALIEWFFLYPLREIGPDVFAFPDYGLYHGEKLLFRRAGSGEATAVEAASVVFRRRPDGAGPGGVFRIEPLRPVAELREAIRREGGPAAGPPPESGEFLPADLVDLAALEPGLRFDIRYATANNFLGAAVYTRARAYLQRPAAGALVRAQRRLEKDGYGLLIHDAYRPWKVTKLFWEATPPALRQFVADPAKGSRHNRGAAVDLTLYDLASGEPVEMTGGYDEFTSRSYPRYLGGTSLQRWQRDLLRAAMEAEGFTVYEYEWWHFDYRDWQRYPILDRPLEDLSPR